MDMLRAQERFETILHSFPSLHMMSFTKLDAGEPERMFYFVPFDIKPAASSFSFLHAYFLSERAPVRQISIEWGQDGEWWDNLPVAIENCTNYCFFVALRINLPHMNIIKKPTTRVFRWLQWHKKGDCYTLFTWPMCLNAHISASIMLFSLPIQRLYTWGSSHRTASATLFNVH